jgi:hypothetical protein
LIQARARHLAGPSADSHAVARGLRGWRDAIENIDSYDELVLWYEHDLFDQLNLLQLLTWLKLRLPASTIVSLIEIGSFPGHPAFKGLGELAPHELVSLIGTRVPVSHEQYALAADAWTAFRRNTPETLDALRQTRTSAMPFLRAALTRFFEEYPWTTDGLSRSERRLLQIASTGPVDLMAVFAQMHQGETAYYITDSSLLSLIEEFSRSTPPLMSITPDSLEERMLKGTVAITEHGRALLEGKSDRVATFGIDRWLGGVHLVAGGVEWRWIDTDQRVIQVHGRT